MGTQSCCSVFMKLKLKEKAMDKDRVKGSTTNITGEMKEGAGKLTGDEKLRSDGVMDQIKGKFDTSSVT